MITIRPEQIKAFEEAIPLTLRAEFAKRLRKQYAEKTAALGESGLRQTIDDGFADAEALEIPIGEDVYRLINLKFVDGLDLNPAYTQSLVVRILGNTNVPGSKRLDFIYKNVIGRPDPGDLPPLKMTEPLPDRLEK